MHSSAGPERRRANCGLPALIEYFSGTSPLSGQVAPSHQQSRDREYQGRQPGRAILRLEHFDQPATRRFYFGEQNFILALTTFPRTKCSSPAPHRSSPLFWRAVARSHALPSLSLPPEWIAAVDVAERIASSFHPHVDCRSYRAPSCAACTAITFVVPCGRPHCTACDFAPKHLDVEIDQHGSLSLVIEECRPFIISPS